MKLGTEAPFKPESDRRIMEEVKEEERTESCYMMLYEKVGVALRFRKSP